MILLIPAKEEHSGMKRRLLLAILFCSAFWTCPKALAQLQPEVESQTVFDIEDSGRT
ncbi:hypothetical protein BH11VER1_BH11VER1_16120 [soil metagenome]